MLSKRQNLLETIHGGHPDRFVNQYEAFALLFGTPFGVRSRNPKYGEENVVNAWGETCSWPIGTPGPFPVHTPDKIVVKDIEHWQDYVKVPQVVYDAKEWSRSSPKRKRSTGTSSSRPRSMHPAFLKCATI